MPGKVARQTSHRSLLEPCAHGGAQWKTGNSIDLPGDVRRSAPRHPARPRQAIQLARRASAKLYVLGNGERPLRHAALVRRAARSDTIAASGSCSVIPSRSATMIRGLSILLVWQLVPAVALAQRDPPLYESCLTSTALYHQDEALVLELRYRKYGGPREHKEHQMY